MSNVTLILDFIKKNTTADAAPSRSKVSYCVTSAQKLRVVTIPVLYQSINQCTLMLA